MAAKPDIEATQPGTIPIIAQNYSGEDTTGNSEPTLTPMTPPKLDISAQ